MNYDWQELSKENYPEFGVTVLLSKEAPDGKWVVRVACLRAITKDGFEWSSGTESVNAIFEQFNIGIPRMEFTHWCKITPPKK